MPLPDDMEALRQDMGLDEWTLAQMEDLLRSDPYAMDAMRGLEDDEIHARAAIETMQAFQDAEKTIPFRYLIRRAERERAYHSDSLLKQDLSSEAARVSQVAGLASALVLEWIGVAMSDGKRAMEYLNEQWESEDHER